MKIFCSIDPFLARAWLKNSLIHCFKGSKKVLRVLHFANEQPSVSTEYFKKLQGTDEIWEIRAKRGRNAYRLLGFLDEGRLVVLTNGFAKKTRKTPESEITLAEKRKTEYLSRKQNGRS